MIDPNDNVEAIEDAINSYFEDPEMISEALGIDGYKPERLKDEGHQEFHARWDANWNKLMLEIGVLIKAEQDSKIGELLAPNVREYFGKLAEASL